MDEEIKEFLLKEQAICGEQRLKAIETAQAAIDTRDFYTRRGAFIQKILDLFDK